MSVPNLDKEVQKALKDLERCYSRVIPVKVGKEVVSSVRQNFRSGGFYCQRWQTTKRQQVPFTGASGRYGPLLSRTTHLMSSTDYVPGNARVTIRNTAPYAQYHNEGATSTVTPKMKKFFWAKYYESGLASQIYGSGKGKRMKQKSDAFAKESDFWKAMALKKPGSKIRIPQRQFLGPSPQVDRLVSDIVNKELEQFIKTHFR